VKNFDDCFDVLMGHEGGYVNHPKDPGGETMWGITARVARAYGYTGPMKDLPKSTAKEIAKKLYWDSLGCDDYPVLIAWQLFDTVYNGGKPVLWAQQAVGVKADGKLGPITRRAIAQANPKDFALKYLAARGDYLTGLNTWPSFGKGWARRIFENMRLAAKDI
jgi:lysozyme family protein